MAINIAQMLRTKQEQPMRDVEALNKQKEEIEQQINKIEQPLPPQPQVAQQKVQQMQQLQPMQKEDLFDESFNNMVEKEQARMQPIEQSIEEEQPHQEILINIEFTFVGYIREVFNIKLANEEQIDSLINTIRDLIEKNQTIKLGEIILNSHNILSFRLV